MSGYVTAATGVPAIGRALGQFLGYLSALTGANLDTMHLVGFSLGAHLVGNAGHELGGKVGRITDKLFILISCISICLKVMCGS